MTMLDSLNQAVASRGGTYVKLRTTDDPPVKGEILSFEERDRTDPEGNIVYKRGTQTPRKEWLFTLRTDETESDDDDGVRKFAANESAQGAIAAAIKASGHKAEIGGRLQVAVKANAEDSYKQATYAAKYDPPALAVPTDDIFDD